MREYEPPISAKPFNTYQFQTADIKNQHISANAFPAVIKNENVDAITMRSSSNETIEKQGSKTISEINFSDEKEIFNWIKKAEESTKSFQYEVGYTITSDGKVWRTVGGKAYFDISDITSNLENSYSYHNHPDDVTYYSFSDMDLAKFVSNHEQYAKASDSQYEYTLIRTKDTIEKSHEEVYHLFKKIYKTSIYQLAFDGEIDIDTDGYHETNKILCEMLNIEYERRKKE